MEINTGSFTKITLIYVPKNLQSILDCEIYMVYLHDISMVIKTEYFSYLKFTEGFSYVCKSYCHIIWKRVIVMTNIPDRWKETGDCSRQFKRRAELISKGTPNCLHLRNQIYKGCDPRTAA